MTRREFFKTLLGKSSFNEQFEIKQKVIHSGDIRETVALLQAQQDLDEKDLEK